MKRKSIPYLLLIIFTILLGLGSRTSVIPNIIYPYLGDAIYAVMWFLIIGLLLPKSKTVTITVVSLLVCYSIELLQLYNADWINTIRNYKLGGLLLGFGFLWSDMVSYTLGGITAAILEVVYYKRK